MMSKKQWFVLLCLLIIYILLGGWFFYTVETKEESRKREIAREEIRYIEGILFYFNLFQFKGFHRFRMNIGI